MANRRVCVCVLPQATKPNLKFHKCHFGFYVILKRKPRRVVVKVEVDRRGNLSVRLSIETCNVLHKLAKRVAST